MALVLVLGTADVGSAVAHALFIARHGVVLHDNPMPSHSRRGMSFSDALYHGKARLENILAKYARTADDLIRMIRCRGAIPVIDMQLEHVLATLRPDVLVDARMKKHRQPEPQRGLAPLTVGLGPNFVAGQTTDVVVETSWGTRLGEVIRAGRALDLAGEPREICGHARDRFVYSPVTGIFRTTLDIGAMVVAGQPVGWIDTLTLRAPLTGRLRGLAHDGARIEVRAKIIEVDPRRWEASVRGLGERPKKIAHAVLGVVAEDDAGLAKSPTSQS